jgi:hypothetical protein
MDSNDFILQLETLIEQRINAIKEQQFDSPLMSRDLEEELILIQRAFPKIINLLLSIKLGKRSEPIEQEEGDLSRFIFNSLKFQASLYVELIESQQLTIELEELNKELGLQ